MLTLCTAIMAGAVAASCPVVQCDSAASASACSKKACSTETVALSAMGDRAAGKDIVAVAVEAGSFKTLAAALEAADLVEALQGTGPFTVFAPTDEAFARLPKGTVETLLKPENKAMLVSVLTYHVVPGRVTADQVVKLTGAETLNGQRVDIAVKNGAVMIDNATVVKADVMASNGVIHVIDHVVLPTEMNIPQVAVENGFSTLAAALEAAGLVEALSGKGPFTVFAPTDAAFAKLPKGTLETLLKPENKAQLVEILTYHVVPGRVFADKAVTLDSAASLQGSPIALKVVDGALRVNGAKVVAADVDASNGVIHVIDAVILPPAK